MEAYNRLHTTYLCVCNHISYIGAVLPTIQSIAIHYQSLHFKIFPFQANHYQTLQDNTEHYISLPVITL